jgi:hypothetical protein
MSDSLIYAIWIGVPFVLAAMLTAFTRASAILIGCLLPVVALILAFAYLMFFVAHVPTNSTAPVIIPFAFICTTIGSLPGAVTGLSLRELVGRWKRTQTD